MEDITQIRKEFNELNNSSIARFAGKKNQVIDGLFGQLESHWADYTLVKDKWVGQIKDKLLAGRALEVALLFSKTDYDEFKKFMYEEFNPTVTRNHLKLRMTSPGYLNKLPLRQAITQALEDYDTIGKAYDDNVCALRLAERVPVDLRKAHQFRPYIMESGREILYTMKALTSRIRLGYKSQSSVYTGERLSSSETWIWLPGMRLPGLDSIAIDGI
ncbi:hypothetical protein GGI12_001931 [Dipsacomyces acuminosporus]|nr:hypothetical protein GGI12_001931 [Dipsacomyces acuminosporus]